MVVVGGSMVIYKSQDMVYNVAPYTGGSPRYFNVKVSVPSSPPLVYSSRLYYVLYQLKTVGTLPLRTFLHCPEIGTFVPCRI